MENRFITFLTSITAGQVTGFVTSETASFDEARASASIILAESASLTFEQMYSVSSSFWTPPSASLPVNNYHVNALDQSTEAYAAAYVLSSSFVN